MTEQGEVAGVVHDPQGRRHLVVGEAVQRQVGLEGKDEFSRASRHGDSYILGLLQCLFFLCFHPEMKYFIICDN